MNSKDLKLQCSLCQTFVKEPCILNCLHSFCHDCVISEGKTGKDEDILCTLCEQKSCLKSLRRNYFLENFVAKSLLENHRKMTIVMRCNNCSENHQLLKYCKQCMEYLCETCVYCHKNTKLTREHRLMSLEEFEESLITRCVKRSVYCHNHDETLVEKYCRSCDETSCPGCEHHVNHNQDFLHEDITGDIKYLQELLTRATSRILSHEDVASRCCNMVDELRERKNRICKQINGYFMQYRQLVEEEQEEMLQSVLTWYNTQFEAIKHAQKSEETRMDKISDAVRFSKTLLQLGTNAEILSLKSLVQSQLLRVAKQKTGAEFILSAQNVIRNASWNISTDQYDCHLKSVDLTLPNILKEMKYDAENDEIDDEVNVVSKKKENHGKTWKRVKELLGRKHRGLSGLDGVHFHVGSSISRANHAVWGNGEISSRDYRYDKILRNRIIGKRGSGSGEFQHPCDVCVDISREDRLIVTDFNNCRVQVFSYFGEFLFSFGKRGCGPSQFNGPTGVAVLHDGTIIVADSLNNRIQQFTSEGLFMNTFGSEGRGEGQFWRPMGIAVDSRDRIIIVDQGNNRVQVFTSEGQFLFAFAEMGNWDGQVSCPNFVAADQQDNIYVSDEINMRVQIFRNDGTYVKKITAREIHGRFHDNVDHLSGIVVDTRGYVIVGVKSSCSVRVFSPDGRFIRAFSSTRAPPSRLLFSSGIALTSAGEIVICDWFNNRIRFF